MTPEEERAMRDELEDLGMTIERARRVAVAIAWLCAIAAFVFSSLLARAAYDGGAEWLALAVLGAGYFVGVVIGRDMPKKRR